MNVRGLAVAGRVLLALIYPLLVWAGLTALAARAIGLDERAFLVFPTFASWWLLVVFGRTLVRGPPMIERFARLQKPDLPPAEVAHCRAFTVVWTAFFAVNGAIALGLGVAAPVGWWVLYTGLIAYVLMGVLLVAEVVVRVVRFGWDTLQPPWR